MLAVAIGTVAVYAIDAGGEKAANSGAAAGGCPMTAGAAGDGAPGCGMAGAASGDGAGGCAMQAEAMGAKPTGAKANCARAMGAALKGAAIKVTNTAKGVTITVTSDKPEQVKAIQAHLANFGKWDSKHASACTDACDGSECKDGCEHHKAMTGGEGTAPGA